MTTQYHFFKNRKYSAKMGRKYLMEFTNKLNTLSSRSRQLGPSLQTEEATKNALVMPFLSTILGYDVFDPTEVIPEFTADVGTKKGEKVDYALVKDNQVQILVECKKYSEPLSVQHASQLFRYFAATQARIAILTNGHQYLFFTDLDAPNKMDEKPFLQLDLEDIDEHAIPEIAKMTKQSFNLDSILNAAEELKYVQQTKSILNTQYKNPEDDFVRFFATRIYNGVLTQKVRDQFSAIVAKALNQYISDRINDRLKTAMDNTGLTTLPTVSEDENSDIEESKEATITTTEEEIEGFYLVLSIIRTAIDSNRIAYRDTQSYFGILVDDNNRKPICRLHFNRTQKYIGLFDEEKKETRHPITKLDDIFQFSTQLVATAHTYL
ncbi:type I restriction enzyme HsdR N-terminal domain-containing protein [Chromobacterium haemolyticum]|nr:type I restriction enzyme HsdR N-terminal domain-containing protein [Chromobacterium haemolyticum]